MCWVSKILEGSGERRAGGSVWGLHVDQEGGVEVGSVGGPGCG